MDRFMYLAMSGAKENLYAQAINNHNLANATTHGFRQSLADAYTAPIRGPVYDSRDYVQVGNEAIDFSHGALQSTGRDLDVAIQGEGFIAVQAPDGGEAYTRAGNLHVDATGMLLTDRGLPVLGGGGPITVPPDESILIGTDGTITIRPEGSAPNALAAVDRIRLVNPDIQTLERKEDGLIRAADGQEVEADANVRVITGMLETSNVNTVAALTRMIELSRTYETQIKMMETANNIEENHNRLLGTS
ncbi:flagellar basal-body rod protein FlgF [Thiorhodococcus mannitoliphagus]|uniref:Flagellar basal-body rod protein FlgF n=1 Tax=Thiorhodococcus mannitoliphagus TaxID=329406 RepID=A0A6P1DUC7_9GAMM|nr:flagellar basal-body rod protein FlgF [Thiorhodococcus mannitoliphagus]NEX21070.1 flagellar basal-body rod protein FlgF [Thiorhodococcus mannitoliphagus]